LDRCNTLITPQNEEVIEMKNEYLQNLDKQHGREVFENMSLQERFDNLTAYVKSQIIWKSDIVTRYLAGDVATPEEAIKSAEDDCRGHAVVTVSILINMGYDANVAETPWHWYTIVYHDGNEYLVNYYYSRSAKYDYALLMVFNDEEIRYIRNPFGQYFATMNTHQRFLGYIYDLGMFSFLIAVFLGIAASGYSSVVQSEMRMVFRKEKKALKYFLIRSGFGIALSVALISLLFFISLPPLNGIGGIYVFVYGLTFIFTFLSSQFLSKKIKKIYPTEN
jgi:hypothetical protein